MKFYSCIFLLFFSFNLFSQEVLPCGEVHEYEEPPLSPSVERDFIDYKIRLNNQCGEEVLFKLDFSTIVVPDRFQILEPNTNDVIIDTKWVWCNSDHLTPAEMASHCVDGFSIYTPSGIEYIGGYYSDLPDDYYLTESEMGSPIGKGRIEFLTNEDIFIFRIFPHYEEYTIGYFYLHCANSFIGQEDLCIVETYSNDTICTTVEQDSEYLTQTYYLECCDSIVFYPYKYVDNKYTLEDTIVCPNTDLILENPYEDSLSGFWSTGTDFIFVDQDTTVYFYGNDPEGCNHIIPKKINLFGAEFFSLQKEYHVKKISKLEINLCDYEMYNVYINDQPIDNCVYVKRIKENQEISLEFLDANGCFQSIILEVFIHIKGEIYQPNVFSPNNDGKNDFFRIFDNDGYVKWVKEFKVFDRWGELIYEQFNAPLDFIKWDGIYRGKPVNSGVYVYYMLFYDYSGKEEIIKGDITVLR